MKPYSFLLLLAAMAAFLIIPAPASSAIQIAYRATDLADAGTDDWWQYEYYVSGYTFNRDMGFTVYFEWDRYGSIDPLPTAPNGDWDVLTWDPDPEIPDDGAYDALALAENASLADAFTVGFVWPGSGTPDSQYFEVYKNLDDGSVETLLSGETVPVPVPTTLLLLASGLAGLLGNRARKKRTVSNPNDVCQLDFQ
jgi:hypothetical protein